MASGFELEGVKWGDSAFGTSGGTVTFAFARAGTSGGAFFSGSFDSPLTGAFGTLVQEAFSVWEAVADIDFEQVSIDAGADIVLGFDYLDGPANVVGLTAYFPSGNSFAGATIQFDAAEKWQTDTKNTGQQGSDYVNFYSTALHEIGHALGLGHVDDEGEIMNPYTTSQITLGLGDIEGAQTLYGARGAGSYGTPGNDVFATTAGNDVYYGDGGFDIVQFAGPRSGFTVNRTGDTLVVTGLGTDQLHDVSRLQFTDGTLAFDATGSAGGVYRLYSAAFDRSPDALGLAFWVKQVDGGASLAAVADSFASSAEFSSLHAGTGTALVQEFYRSVLGREGSADELGYWAGQLASGTSIGSVLLGFANSAENAAKTAAALDNGVFLVPVGFGTQGNDSFTATAGNDAFYGFNGVDTVQMGGARAGFALSFDGSTVSATGAGSDSFVGIERLHFTDGTLAFDSEGAAGQAYRLYAAAFDRTPDTAGLAYQVARLDSGAGLGAVASGFAASAEFAGIYGDGSDHRTEVEQLYRNVLHREGEASGIDYWTQRLDSGVSIGTVLLGFSESAENRAATAAATAGGLWLG